MPGLPAAAEDSRCVPRFRPGRQPAAKPPEAALRPSPPPSRPRRSLPPPLPRPVAANPFDEIGLQAAAPNDPCPGCTEAMPIAAVVCIKCGYNKNLGRRMQTMKMSGEGGGGHDGHGGVAQELLNRAAQVIDEDAEEEVKKTQQGVPWWVFLIARFCSSAWRPAC